MVIYGSAQFLAESPNSWICFVGALPSGRQRGLRYHQAAGRQQGLAPTGSREMGDPGTENCAEPYSYKSPSYFVTVPEYQIK